MFGKGERAFIQYLQQLKQKYMHYLFIMHLHI